MNLIKIHTELSHCDLAHRSEITDLLKLFSKSYKYQSFFLISMDGAR
jgi:hypothetical protein